MLYALARHIDWSLRDYGTPPLVWGGREDCAHSWGDELPEHHPGQVNQTMCGHSTGVAEGQTNGAGQFCHHCNAWRGSLGLEPTPALYVAHLVEVMREVHRVLRDDGIVWLNLGDSYAGSWGNYAPGGIKGTQRPRTENGKRWERPAYSSTTRLPPAANAPGLKPKDLIGMPWRVALALQSDGCADFKAVQTIGRVRSEMLSAYDGDPIPDRVINVLERLDAEYREAKGNSWWLRSAIVWAKGVSFCKTYSGSCMPESVRDRPTNSYEMVFLLAKSARYYYDQEAVKENVSGNNHDTNLGQNARHKHGKAHEHFGVNAFNTSQYTATTRNLRSVWTIPDTLTEFAKFCETQGVDLDALADAYADGQRDVKDVFVINPSGSSRNHYAAYPEALVRPMILAGTSAKGVCPECGAGWVRCADNKSVVQSGYGNQTVQGMSRIQTAESVLPAQSENVQCVLGAKEEGTTTCQPGTRAGDIETISGDAQRAGNGAQAQVLRDGTRKGIDACERAQVSPYGEGEKTIAGRVVTMGKDGEGQIEQSDSLCPEESAPFESAGGIRSSGLDSNPGATKEPLSILQGTVHREQSCDDGSCDTPIEGRGTQSGEHSSGVPVLQLQEMEPSTGRTRGKALETPRNDGERWNENNGRGFRVKQKTIRGWRPGCQCNAGNPVPATCLDPFVGSGTTCHVAEELGRDSIGIDLSGDYVEMARRRINRTEEIETVLNGEPVTVEQVPMWEVAG